jgi:hypothetical protein
LNSTQEILLNTSFEKRLDGFKVIGSYNYTRDRIDGNYSLAVYSKGIEWPTVYKIVPIYAGEEKLKISLYIKGSNITNLHVKLLFFNYTPEHYEEDRYTISKEYIKIYEMGIKENEWFHVEKSIIPPRNAKTVMVVCAKNIRKVSDNVIFRMMKPFSVSEMIKGEKIWPK